MVRKIYLASRRVNLPRNKEGADYPDEHQVMLELYDQAPA